MVAGKGKGKGKPVDPDQIPLDDPEAERLRLRRLQEKADEDVIDDLFDNKKRNDLEDDLFADDNDEDDDVEIQYDITDTFDDVSLDTTTAQSQFSKEVFSKIKECQAKGAVHKFLYELMKECCEAKEEGEKNLKIADCEDLQKKLMTCLKEKRKANADKTLAEKKANDMTKKNAKIDVHSEMAMMYGGDEEWDEEEY
jgi:hypothetical protein